MATLSKVISGSELGECEQWELPEMQATAVGGPLTASQLQGLHKQAYDDGYEAGKRLGEERGYQEGMKKAGIQSEQRLEELEGRIAHIQRILECMAAPLEKLDHEVEESLVRLSMSVARHLVRRELKSDPGQVIAVLREAMNALPITSSRVRLSLHPEDAALVREALSVSEAEGKWQLVEDPVLTRGGCKLVTETSQIDATIESRVAAAVAKILGEERDDV